MCPPRHMLSLNSFCGHKCGIRAAAHSQCKIYDEILGTMFCSRYLTTIRLHLGIMAQRFGIRLVIGFRWTRVHICDNNTKVNHVFRKMTGEVKFFDLNSLPFFYFTVFQKDNHQLMFCKSGLLNFEMWDCCFFQPVRPHDKQLLKQLSPSM